MIGRRTTAVILTERITKSSGYPSTYPNELVALQI
jgi:hypothetical protein